MASLGTVFSSDLPSYTFSMERCSQSHVVLDRMPEKEAAVTKIPVCPQKDSSTLTTLLL